MKKITKTVYMVDGREYDNASEATTAARASRVANLLDKWADNNGLSIHQYTGDLAQIIVRQFAELMQAVNGPVPVEVTEADAPHFTGKLADVGDSTDADFEAENDANEAPRPVSKVRCEDRDETTDACMDCGHKFVHAKHCARRTSGAK